MKLKEKLAEKWMEKEKYTMVEDFEYGYYYMTRDAFIAGFEEARELVYQESKDTRKDFCQCRPCMYDQNWLKLGEEEV